MTANKNLLRMKFARVIEAYAERSGCSLDEALDRFYRSNVYVEMRDGVSDMHCMSDEYLRVVVKGKNDLQSLFPDLCKEWDRAKNGDLHPDQITPGNNGKDLSHMRPFVRGTARNPDVAAGRTRGGSAAGPGSAGHCSRKAPTDCDRGRTAGTP